MRRRSVIVAFLAAPLAAPAVVWLLLMVEAVFAGQFTFNGAWAALALYVAIGAPAAYAATTVVGLPGWMIATRLGVVSRVGTILTGAATGAVVAWLVAPQLKGELMSIPLGPWRAGVAGVAVGFVWFALASRTDP